MVGQPGLIALCSLIYRRGLVARRGPMALPMAMPAGFEAGRAKVSASIERTKLEAHRKVPESITGSWARGQSLPDCLVA